MLEVLAAGPLSTVQDRGRVGCAHLGVPRSGALDQPALDLGNRLVGNDPDAAGLELSFGRFHARLDNATGFPAPAARLPAPAVFAVTGAPAPVLVDGRPGAFGVALTGREVSVGVPVAGVHTYLAVRGGIAVPPVLGSRSADTLSGLGPPPLRAGDLLPLGTASGKAADVDFTPTAAYPDEIRIRVRFGPRDDWFTDPFSLLSSSYRVASASRIGVRLAGPPLTRAVTSELPSEGLVCGAVQVPGDGRPIVFLADHPTTGGYPVVGVVHPDDLPCVAQARPGARVVFCGP